MAAPADIEVRPFGTVWLFTPLAAEACAWWDDNVDPCPEMAGAKAVEHRCVDTLIERDRDAGLSVEIVP